ncbi:signal recognition particle-docking protein FtsY [Corynebacterium sp. zg-331]|uniref:signal recognition particle-docking protein FtsY n=1 Tax=unclassified Corynebacterium TaxID=2624378 RepID=UPI00128DF45E|nr:MULTISPECIES: signal recognition particle-docking protein FtsY [unclassified Corynebacterium]MBC3185293.1 signal recognition particle-docking protein FtsY [Corynebacterium sp. zg-331]MPV51790.1 signal recognition particle-docking protein FtsY [Corynebacterium sp. zg331]
MTTDFWIIAGIALLVILLLTAVLVLIGRKNTAAKTVTFEKKDQETPKQLTQQEKSGNYQAKGGFNFATGGSTADASVAALTKNASLTGEEASKEPVPQVRRTHPRPSAPAKRVKPAPESAQQPAAHEPRPVTEPTAEKFEKKAEEQSEKPGVSVDLVQDAPEPPRPAVQEAPREEVRPGVAVVDEAQPERKPVEAVEDAVEDKDAREVEPSSGEDEVGADVPAEAVEAERPEEAIEAAAAAVTAQAAAEALEKTPAPQPHDEEPVAREEVREPQEEIAPVAGRLGRLRGRLSRSQNVIGKSVLGILSAGDLDEDAWEEIEDTLVMADLGTAVTTRVVEDLRTKIAQRGVSSEAEARTMLRETLIEACQPEMDRSIKAMPYEGKPAVVLVVGVNGTGKTTTTGKLARVLVSMGHTVVLGAADTFRAAAADQLETWGCRVGATTVRGEEGADPASVAFDAVARGVADQADVVLVDTAGRLHTSVGLMDQLGKVKRVVEKKARVDEVLLVLDATVGQNGLMQARTFSEVVDISGVVLTKLDGSAKGGIVLRVQEELGVPVKLVGLGEGSDDLAPFEVEGFVDALLGESA